MNKKRLQRLVDAVAKIQGAFDELEIIRDEEQEAFDNMPESLQYSEKGELTEQNANDLDYAVGDLESALNTLDDIVNNN